MSSESQPKPWRRHLWEELVAGADALSASIFHSADYAVQQIKDYSQAKQIEVRQ